MSELLETLVLRCPYHLAQGYLADSVGARAASGEQRTLTLTATVPGMELSKAVMVSFGSAVDPMHFDQPWRIHWTPQSGLYPEFEGELTVRADETYETSRLELRGSYRPPGGIAGAAFDWVAGGRIASATARALLRRLGDEMEARYQRDEQAKRDSTTL
ncbi:MAG TPA: hypothetical protein VKR56_13850 [Candidatus Cybelea sp.]|nr:hypothetical protein [Candidatus Cybelea sp.]